MAVAAEDAPKDLPAPRVGVGVIVVRDGHVLVGERRGAHGAHTWAFPGGHLEHGESIEACAARELLEETGLVAARFTLGPYTNDVFADEQKHYVTLFAIAHGVVGEPAILEPEKCAGWSWCRWTELPSPRFAPLDALVRSGFVPDGVG